MQGHLEIVKALVDGSGDSRAAVLLISESVYGCTCLHAACYFGHVTIVEYLLSLSCVGLVGLLDRSGYTELELAVAAGQTAMVEAIRRFKASGSACAPRPTG